MQGIKLIVVKIAIIVPIMLLSLAISTQIFAAIIKVNGLAPLAMIFGYKIYAPWMVLVWMFGQHNIGLSTFHMALSPLYVGAAVAIVVAAWLSKKNQTGKHIHHGSARWANNQEIQDAGLHAELGVMLGLRADGKYYLRHAGPEHICVFAPTRSGKGVGLVVPTLLTWRGSVVCFDPKAENWRITSGFRSTFTRCIYFDPTSTDSARFNPLFEVRKGDNEIKDVQNIADILVDPEGSNDRRNHWDRTAHSLLVGVILHVLYAEPNKSLAGVAQFLSDPARSFLDTLRIMMMTMHLGNKVHPVVASSARELLNKAENERSGVLSTAMSFLALYRDPVVARATNNSDFHFADLLNNEQPVSLYLAVPPSDLSRIKPLIRLLLNQMGRRLTEKMDSDHKRTESQQLLLLLDEFPSLGKLDFFESSLAYIAGYGIRALLITQSLNQIEKVYGPNNSILDNCHIRIAFAANDDRTAKRVSDLLGTKTESKDQQSFSGQRNGVFLSNVSISEQSFARPLLTPAEVNQLAPDKEIVFVAGMPPILGKKLAYFKDDVLKKRVIEPYSYARNSTEIMSEWSTEKAKALIPSQPQKDLPVVESPQLGQLI